MQAFETTGTIDPTGQLTLDQPLQVAHSAKVRVIVLLSENVNDDRDQIEASEQDFSAQGFLSMIDEIRAQVPDEEWKYKATKEKTTDSQQSDRLPPFLQFVEEISAQIPGEEWEKLPKDLSKNVDHYLYGAPKDEE